MTTNKTIYNKMHLFLLFNIFIVLILTGLIRIIE